MQKGLKKYFVNMDEYLANLGLYRKMVARDASSLFRAVSEQLYYSQNYHHTIRQDCANFMRANASVFEPFVEGSFEKYLERLEDPKESVGQVEIKALSQLYRRCFLIYRYPGKAATVISEGDFHDRVTLSCSINGHYDIVYPRSYVASAALCQSVVYELLYTKVFGWEEAELSQAAESFRAGARRYRNSPSASSDVDFGYDIPEERGHREEAEPSEERPRATEDVKPLSEAPPPSRLCLPYKVMKSLDGDIYRNVEFDVWQDTCKEMQKTDYMVFAGRQYFLGDKCQVRLEPKGKYFNAFIQEVGTHSSAVTVFIEELGEKHLVPLTDLKPVNPVPAWNVSAPTRKGELDTEARGHQRRHRYFRKSRGGGAVVKGAELAMPQSYGGPAPSPLPPRFQPAGHPRPPLPPGPPAAGAAPYDPYAPPHQHAARPPRYGAPRGSTRLVNRHLIGPQFSYYPPGRRYYDYDGVAFRSRRSRRHAAAALAKECHFFNADEAPAELDAAVPYFHVDDAGGPDVFATLTSPSVPQSQSVGALPPPSGSPYHVQRGSCPLPLTPPGGGALGGSSEEDLEDPNAVDERDASYQTPIVYTSDAAHVDAPAGQDQDEACVAESPPRADLNYSFPQQVVKPVAVISSSPSSSSSSSSSSRLPASATHAQPRSVAMAMPAATPWLVNELGDGLCSVVAPPPYSYDPSGADLPRDCRLLQFYFNLGVQWYHQSCWQPQQAYSPDAAYPYQHYVPPYGGQEAPLHAAPHSYLEFGRGPHQVPAPYPDSTRMTEAQMDGLAHPPEGSSLDAPAMYPDQMAPPPVPHLPYEAPPPAAYLSSAPPPTLVHSAPHSYHAVVPASAHWGGHASRVYCPAPNPAHVVGYITAPSAHFLPPSA